MNITEKCQIKIKFEDFHVTCRICLNDNAFLQPLMSNLLELYKRLLNILEVIYSMFDTLFLALYVIFLDRK